MQLRGDAEAVPANKRMRTGPKPEDLKVGTEVIYHGNKRGIVREAYAPFDEYVVEDERTGQRVRHEADEDASPAGAEEGTTKMFKSSDLLLVSEAIAENPCGPAAAAASVLVIGTENHVKEALRIFGAPDERERCDTQMLLGFPTKSCRCGSQCSSFNPWKLSTCGANCPMIKIASEGIDESIFELAQRFRPDLNIAIRPFYLKSAVQQIGTDLQRLDGYFCLSAVTLPYSKEAIEATSGMERFMYEDVYCQIDLGTSGLGPQEPRDRSLRDTARRVLEMTSCMRLSDELWGKEQQLAIRKKLGVDLPLAFWEDNVKVFVILLPEDAFHWVDSGTLCFKACAPSTGTGTGSGRENKTVDDWAKDQDQFKHLPSLPPGWIRCKSTAGVLYYFHPQTRKSQYDEPKPNLPPGWTKEKSKTTGRVYYFNARLKKSMFEVPTE